MNKHSYRKITRLIFACVMLVSLLSGFALADVIYQPDDDFYNSHAGDCEYLNRDYYANGESGYMAPNQYWVPGMFSPMPLMGKYFVAYGGEFLPPYELGLKNVERMITGKMPA